MVLHYSDDLLKTPDPNGGKFGDWIVKKDTFNVTCRLCKSNVCIKEGEKVSVPCFPLLSKLSVALLSIHHSAAEVERTFSVEKEVLTLKRNKMSQGTFNAHMLIRNSVKSIGGCHNVKATITPEMRKAYVSAPARRKEFLEKRKAEESKEAEVLAFNRRRKIKETAGLHKYKLNELCKKLLADKAKIKDKLAEQTKHKKAEKTKQKKAKKRPLSGGSDHCATKKQKTS
ncbi:hypothetical protein NP493_1580g00008 [Ridgeia piscesae]|uniref:HAT C-terminal dimerisation domain-containing protein n=1 Tax=Ridgeia piscesae TaxID=27915 RepID=A0AAD9JXW0_RIDPI|nr:hypothetical protein NP493_1580g00008 [Ridgeia piscesae]